MTTAKGGGFLSLNKTLRHEVALNNMIIALLV
jgi:hypothetical protein